jgi:hypothetical protein
MTALRKLGLFASGLAGMLAVGACGSDGPSADTTIDQQQAAVVGATAADQISDIAGGIGGFGVTGGQLGGGFFSRAEMRGSMRVLDRIIPARYKPELARLMVGGSCDPTVTGDSTDTDGDGIENDATFSFTSGNCFYEDSLGNGWAVTGSVSIQDTDGGATLFGFALDLNRLKVLIYTDSASAGLDWDGSYTANVTSTSVTTSRHFVSRFHVNNTTPYTFRDNWTLTFVPDTGTIDPSTQSELPDGTFDVTGSYGWTGKNNLADGNWTFNVSTPTPLHWLSQCEGIDPPFDGGQLLASINGRSNVGFTADFSACGTPAAINTFDNSTSALR